MRGARLYASYSAACHARALCITCAQLYAHAFTTAFLCRIPPCACIVAACHIGDGTPAAATRMPTRAATYCDREGRTRRRACVCMSSRTRAFFAPCDIYAPAAVQWKEELSRSHACKRLLHFSSFASRHSSLSTHTYALFGNFDGTHILYIFPHASVRCAINSLRACLCVTAR